MKKILQTGLAFGIENGSCSACNLNYSWLFNSPSNLLWVDKIVVTKPIWDILMQDSPIEKVNNQGMKAFGNEIQKTMKLVYEILNSVNLIEVIQSNDISEEDSSLIYAQIDDDINLLKYHGFVNNEDDHMYSIANHEYCIPMLWSLYASLLFSRKENCSFSLEDSDLSYLNTLLPIKLGYDFSIGKKSSAINNILEMFLPEVQIWTEFLYENKERCQLCNNYKKCDDSYLITIENRLFNLLEQREHDEIKEFCKILDSICDKRFKDAYEIVPLDLLRELNIEKVKVQRKLNRVYKKVNQWSKIVGTISAGLSLGAFFNYPEITAIGGVGIFASQTTEKINNYFLDKYNWVNFVNKHAYKAQIALNK